MRSTAPASSTRWSEVAAPVAIAAAILLAVIVGARLLAHRIAMVPGWELSTSKILASLDAWRTQPAPNGTTRIAYFADSLSRCGNDTSVRDTLWPKLRASGHTIETLDVFGFAIRPLAFYYLIADVVAARPSVALIEINPTSSWPTLPPLPEMRYRPLSRRLDPARIWTVRDALTADGIGWLDPWVYRIEENLGLLYLVDGLQEAWRSRMAKITELVSLPLLGPPPMVLRSFIVHQAKTVKFTRVEGPLETYPSTIALRALVSELRANGIGVFVYVAPRPPLEKREPRIQIEDFHDLRRAVGVEPEEWLDLATLIAADRFRDTVGHMYPDGCAAVANAIGTVLGPRLATETR